MNANDESFGWCVRSAERALNRGDAEKAALWARIAGRLTEYFGSSQLSDASMERLLAGIGAKVPGPLTRRIRPSDQPVAWLHVLTQAYPTGGHTALCRRWIELDSSADMHDVVLTDQRQSDSDSTLADVVNRRAGTMTFLDSSTGITERAAALRTLACKHDIIVFHVHMWDPIGPTAFGISGGPPVLIVNHADHLYWMGASVADQVINIRPSGEMMCARFRGLNRCARLSIPLLMPREQSAAAGLDAARLRSATRALLHIDAGHAVFLTVGSAYKYEPMANLSFFDAAAELLSRLPAAHLIAVGPPADGARWQALTAQSGGRVHAVGRQLDLNPYFAAADVYLEGFPFGSLTALLEAALSGLPPVLGTAECPLPFRSDDFGIDISPPSSVASYVDRAVELVADAPGRARVGADIRRNLTGWHCGEGWNAKLGLLREAALELGDHAVHPLLPLEPLPETVQEYWSSFSSARTRGDDPFRFAIRTAITVGLTSRVDAALYAALCASYKAAGKTMQAHKLAAAATALSLLPSRWASRIFRGSSEI